jgi:YHS domain-containing protein
MAQDGGSIDPICGKAVVEDDAPSVEYKRRTYSFCSEKCRRRFEHQAERIHVAELAKMGALFAEPRRPHWGVA